MTKTRNKYFLEPFIALLICIFNISVSYGQIAILPIRDLTVYPPGIDLKLTELIYSSLKKEGVAVIEPVKVYKQLEKDNIYATGIPEIAKVISMYNTGATTLLWGYKIETDEKKHLYGIILFTTSIPDGKTYWSKTFYYQPEEKLLGLGNNFPMKKIKRIIMEHAVKEIPEKEIRTESTFKNLKVGYFSIFPRYIKSGEETKLLLKTAGNTQEEKTYIHIDGETATLRRTNGAFTGVFTPRLPEGKYPVYIEENGKKIYLDQLVIDNTPPKVFMKLKGLKKIGKTYFLNKKLFILLGMKAPDNVESWSFKITDGSKQEIFKKFGKGAPNLSINWDPVKATIEKGIYTATLEVNDIAGNKASLKQSFYYYDNIPAPKITLYNNKKEETVLKIGKISAPVKLKKIVVKVYSPKGYPLGKTEIESLPAEITFKANYKKLKIRLFIEDEIGNKSEKDYNIRIKTYKEVEEERGWVEEF